MLISRDSLVEWTGETNPRLRARCLDFPLPNKFYDPWFENAVDAMSICNGDPVGPVCPVRDRCLKRALVNNERFGIWGGMLHDDRKRLKDDFPDDPEMWTWRPPAVQPPRPSRDRAARRG